MRDYRWKTGMIYTNEGKGEKNTWIFHASPNVSSYGICKLFNYQARETHTHT